mmetsp:Transcript_9751/g.17195  ORF Transcript_9751/g.17195 Transcript_9751/m.17195 type:complete len:465 (+) Transcript_9751:85-1479(+)
MMSPRPFRHCIVLWLLLLRCTLIAAGPLIRRGAAKESRHAPQRNADLTSSEAEPSASTLYKSDAETKEALASRRLMEADCNTSLSKDVLREYIASGIDLGARFLVQSQREAGNFRYEYNWQTKAESNDDNPVRQAGTLWGLSLLHLDGIAGSNGTAEQLLPAIRKGLKYFLQHSSVKSGGRRVVIYPGQAKQKTGVIALLALTHIEVLRKPEKLEPAAISELQGHLDGYLNTILAAATKKYTFHAAYQEGGEAYGPASPYFDGECLLALIKAAKYLGRDDLWPQIKEFADGGFKKNVKPGLMGKFEEKDVEKVLKRLKGYYQWGTMSWYELFTSGKADYRKYAKRTLRYSGWLSQHLGEHRKANMGYAFEGVIPAFVTAVSMGSQSREKDLACKVREGVAGLLGMQVSHALAEGLARRAPASDARAVGGCQGSLDSSALRIDTTQHQLHAMLMARRLLEQQELI